MQDATRLPAPDGAHRCYELADEAQRLADELARHDAAIAALTELRNGVSHRHGAVVAELEAIDHIGRRVTALGTQGAGSLPGSDASSAQGPATSP